MKNDSEDDRNEIIRLYYNVLIDNSLSAIYFTDPAGKILQVNPAAEEMFGYSTAEFQKLGRQGIFDEKFPPLQKFVDEINMNGRARGELVAIKKNGERFVIDVSSSIFYDSSGNAHTCTIANDITERINAVYEKDFLLHNTLELFILISKDFRIVSFNEQSLHFCQKYINRQILKGLSILDILPPEQLVVFNVIHANVLEGLTITEELVLDLANDERKSLSVRFHPAKNNFGEIVGVFITAIDHTIEKKLEQKQGSFTRELLDRNHFIELILDYLPIGIAVNNIDTGKVTFINKQFTDIYGWTEKELKDVNSFFYHVYPDQAYREEMIRRIMSDINCRDRDQMKWNEVEISTSTGEKRIINARNIPIYDQNLMISTLLDVTTESRQADEIRKTKEYQEALINGTDDYIWSIDNNLCIITSNRAFKKVMESIYHRSFNDGDYILFDGLSDQDKQEWESFYHHALDGNHFQVRKSFFNPHSTRNHHCLISFTTIYDKHSKISGVSCYSKNITDEVENIISLNDIKNKLSKVLDSSLDVICTITKEGYFTQVSRASELIWGYEPAELVGKRFSMLIHPDDLYETENLIQAIILGSELNFIKNRYLHKDEHIVYMEWSVKWDEASQLRYAVGRDVSEKIKVEKALIDSEQKYRSLFYGNPFPMIIWDFETQKILDCNQSTVEKYGYTKEELLSMTIWELRPEEDKPLLKEAIKDEQTYDQVHQKIWRHKKKNGEIIYMDLKGQLIDYDGRRASLVIHNDITEKLLAEENLRKSEAFLAEAQRLAKMGNWNFDFISDKLSWSEELYRVFGTDKETFHGNHNSFVELIDEEDKEYVIATSNRARITGEPFNIEYRITTPDGENRIIEEYGYGEKNVNGEVIRLFGIAQDITERKKAEQKILESKQRYEYVTRATYDAVWDWDILNNKIDWGENYYRIFGLMEEKDSSDFNQFLFRIHPDEKDYFTESIQESILSNAYNWELEHRFLKSDGRYAYVANNAMIIRNIDGKALRIIGAMQDITRRKEEERHLRLLESVITNTDDAILITDAEPLSDPGPKIVYVNEAFTRMTGYKVNEVIGKTPRILQGPKSDKVELSRLSKALRNWEPCEITTINYRKNGEEFWINFSISPVADETGWYTHWIAIERDVTERKIQELQKQLLSDISDIFGESLLLKEILAKVLCKISDFAQFSLSECWLSSTDRVKINHIAKYSKKPEFDYFFNNSNAVKTLSINEGLVGLAWSKGVVHFWEDLYSIDQFTRKAEAQSIGLRSAYSIPLVNNQEVLGVFVFWICDEFVINSHLNELFMNLGGYIGAEVKRKQLEEDLSRLFNLAPDIICILSTDGYFKKFNPALCKMLGYTEDELMEIPYDALVHPEDISTIIEQKELIRAGKQILLYENRLINKLGKYMWISWTATPLLEENLIFAIGKNITKGKELQQLLDSATTLACIGGWEVDMVNNSLFWSDITREIHEVSNDFIPDLESSMLFYIEEHQPIIRKVFSDAMLHGIPYDIEIQMVTARFNKKWVRLIGQAEFINHKCIRIYGSCQDINSQKINALTLTRTLQEKNSILESIGDAFFAVDQSYKITYWNRMAEQLFGKSRDEILGQYLADLYGKEFEGQYRCFFELTMSSKTSHHFETRYESMNAWHEISIYPSDSGFSVYTKDVSYRKNAEKEIQESNERFNLSARATSDIIWDRDIKKNITIRNSDNINKLLGYTKSVSQSPEFDWFALVHSEDRDRMIHYINSVLNDPSQYFMEYGYRLKRQDESYAYLFDKAYIIRDESGTPVRIIGSTQDITRIKENEVQLKKRADELAVSNLELEQFAFVASHDLQEPLRMITSFLTQLDNKYNDILDEKAKKYIFFAVDGAKRMRQIIMDLLEYSRVGRIESALEEIDLVVLISEIEILLQKKVKEKNASIYYHNLPVIYSYKSPIRQVFQNLISNALKYSKVVIPVEIVIKCSAEKEYWKFSVADNGIGIHSEYFDKIFLLFQRLHARSEYSGTGIGLTVSKKIIDNLGGEIWVESEEGKGSIFYFTLPRN